MKAWKFRRDKTGGGGVVASNSKFPAIFGHCKIPLSGPLLASANIRLG